MDKNLVTIAPYVAEFSGTFMLVVCFAQWFVAQTDDAHSMVVFHYRPMAYTAYASLYMALIYTLEAVSGAHFNPAISLCTFLAGKNRFTNVLSYWAAQFSAGLVANWLCGIVNKVGNKAEFYDHNLVVSSLCEVVYCAMLCFVVLNVACSYENMGNSYYGMAIGFTILAGGYACSAVASPALNPAVSIGIDLAFGPMGILQGLRCACCNLLGAALAAVLYRVIRPQEFEGQAGGVLPKCVAEFVGTFLLVMTVLLAVVTKPAFASLAAMACVVSMTYALFTVSGSNFNPAVSLGIALSGRDKLSMVDCATYIALQLSAGALAGLIAGTTAHITGLKLEDIQMALAGHTVGPLDFRPEVRNALLAEVIFTATFVFAVLAATTTRSRLLRSNFHFGLATAGTMAPAMVSMGSKHCSAALNPAVTMGLAAAEFLYHPGGSHPGKWLSWVISQTIGGIVGSLLFRFLYWREFEDRIIPLVAETEGGAEVGSLVGGNEHANKWVAWSGQRPDMTYAYTNKERSCRVCPSM